MLDAKRIKHKALKRLVERNETKGLRQEWLARIKRILAALNAATSPEELNVPGNKWHILKGDRNGTYSVLVSKNWRITFKWDDEGPFEINLEDYHGN